MADGTMRMLRKGNETQKRTHGTRIRQGASYALTSSHALHSRYDSGSAISTLRLPGSLRLAIPVFFDGEQWYQAEQRDSRLHQQRHLCESQRADGSASRKLLSATQGRYRAMPRRHLQLQQKPPWHLFPSWWCGEVVIS